MFRHYRVIFRELEFITSPSYVSMSIAAVGNTTYINKSYYNKIFKTLKIVHFEIKCGKIITYFDRGHPVLLTLTVAYI